MAEKWCFDRHNEVRKINLGRGTSKFTRVQRAYKRRQTLNLGTKQLIRPLLFGRGCLLVHEIMRKKCASEEASHSASTTKVQIDNPTHLCATDAHPCMPDLSRPGTEVQIDNPAHLCATDAHSCMPDLSRSGTEVQIHAPVLESHCHASQNK
jgi:hypothetical protein